MRELNYKFICFLNFEISIKILIYTSNFVICWYSNINKILQILLLELVGFFFKKNLFYACWSPNDFEKSYEKLYSLVRFCVIFYFENFKNIKENSSYLKKLFLSKWCVKILFAACTPSSQHQSPIIIFLTSDCV